jgi:hypothetical protein
MSCAVALISNATDWLIPLATARGILFALQLAALLVQNKKTRLDDLTSSNLKSKQGLA